ncbi:ornithine carbamoyltransferase [Agrilactobacillus fermenti]|uniref:ornithine carbamoyltransferase n=1 Tax=Agrilactobacillus fermenti TaxID=2586909 RepID=UPI001E3900D9|nr:ornithine carbamoyltransferase [Agrilactobacillus fermenti]MCD2256927.1 ornithine carbamoyltransferase [Agrilactobacillus fermenti]
MNPLQGKSFLKEIDFTPEQINYLIDFAIHLDKLKAQHIPHEYLKGQNIALLFEKTSTRTRSAFTVAANDLGAHPEFLGKDDIQLGNKESIADTAKVLGSMFDGIEFRGFAQKAVETLAENAGVPVWNGLTDDWHPTQMIADFMTLKQHFGTLPGLTLTYLGDARNNVAHSLLITAAMLGVNIHFGAPAALQPTDEVMTKAKAYAQSSGSEILVSDNAETAVNGADALYTDVWLSMGEQVDFHERAALLLPYQINQTLLAATGKKSTIVMHCLPAFHDLKTTTGQKIAAALNLTALEITDAVFQSDASVVFTQAHNRMPAIKAIMSATNGHLFA